MIALDTNVFVRFLVDTPDGETEQVRRARELVTAAESRGEQILVTHVVLAETVWVLRKVYKVPKPDVIEGFREVIASAGFTVEDLPAAEAALDAWATAKGDFADFLIHIRAKALGAAIVYTFDVELHAHEGFAKP